MLVRYGGEPSKRGGLFPNNFLKTHKSYKKCKTAKRRKPFPSLVCRKRKAERIEFLAALRSVTSLEQKSKEVHLRTFKELPSELVEYIIGDCFDYFSHKIEKFNDNDLLRYLKEQWGFKVVTKKVAKVRGLLLAGVKFFLHGIAEPFFVTAREIRFHLKRTLGIA